MTPCFCCCVVYSLLSFLCAFPSQASASKCSSEKHTFEKATQRATPGASRFVLLHKYGIICMHKSSSALIQCAYCLATVFFVFCVRSSGRCIGNTFWNAYILAILVYCKYNTFDIYYSKSIDAYYSLSDFCAPKFTRHWAAEFLSKVASEMNDAALDSVQLWMYSTVQAQNADNMGAIEANEECSEEYKHEHIKNIF